MQRAEEVVAGEVAQQRTVVVPRGNHRPVGQPHDRGHGGVGRIAAKHLQAVLRGEAKGRQGRTGRGIRPPHQSHLRTRCEARARRRLVREVEKARGQRAVVGPRRVVEAQDIGSPGNSGAGGGVGDHAPAEGGRGGRASIADGGSAVARDIRADERHLAEGGGVRLVAHLAVRGQAGQQRGRRIANRGAADIGPVCAVARVLSGEDRARALQPQPARQRGGRHIGQRHKAAARVGADGELDLVGQIDVQRDLPRVGRGRFAQGDAGRGDFPGRVRAVRVRAGHRVEPRGECAVALLLGMDEIKRVGRGRAGMNVVVAGGGQGQGSARDRHAAARAGRADIPLEEREGLDIVEAALRRAAGVEGGDEEAELRRATRRK